MHCCAQCLNNSQCHLLLLTSVPCVYRAAGECHRQVTNVPHGELKHGMDGLCVRERKLTFLFHVSLQKQAVGVLDYTIRSQVMYVLIYFTLN